MKLSLVQQQPTLLFVLASMIALASTVVVNADIIINEVSSSGTFNICGGTDILDGDDYVELLNTETDLTKEGVNLTGYTMFDNSGIFDDNTYEFDYTFPLIMPGELVLMCKDALGSFEFGKTCALWANKCADPLIHDEMIALREKQEQGIYHNKDLPNFERRFLPNLNMDILGGNERDGSDGNHQEQQYYYSNEMIEYLERWRVSTIDVRRLGHPLLSTLIEIESSLLIFDPNGQGRSQSPLLPVHVENENIARSNGWDIDSLKQWVQYKSTFVVQQPSPIVVGNSSHGVAHKLFTLPVALAILTLIVSISILCIVVFNRNTPYDITDRTTCYAILFGPFGAILRWQLSKLNNGTITKLPWFPLGTFTANFVASCISIFTVALEYRIGSNFDG